MINDFPHVNDSKSVKLQGPARATACNHSARVASAISSRMVEIARLIGTTEPHLIWLSNDPQLQSQDPIGGSEQNRPAKAHHLLAQLF
jgi:hypothetical protein